MVLTEEGECMKKTNGILILLIIMCLAGFYAYRTMDRLSTDLKAPEITIVDEMLEVSVTDPKSALLQGVTARDRADGDVTDSILVEHITLLDIDGTISVGYAAFDSAGNVAKATRQVKYTDYQRPRFSLDRPMIYTEGSSFDILSTIKASDVLDGDIQHRIRAAAMGQESIAEVGSHNVQFTVSNSLGDTVSLVFPVDVIEPNRYDATLTLTDYLIYLPVGSSFVPGNYLKSFNYRNEETDLSKGIPSNFYLLSGNKVDTSVPGVYPVEYKMIRSIRHETNPQLNQEYTAYSKLIVVVEG